MSSLLREFFTVSFLQGVVLVVVGGPISIAAGLYLHRLTQGATSKRSRMQLLTLIDEAFEINIERMKDFTEDTGRFTVEHADLTLLDATAAVRYEVLDDFELTREITRLHSQLVDINQGLTLLHLMEVESVWKHSADPEDVKTRDHFHKGLSQFHAAKFIKDAEAFRVRIKPILAGQEKRLNAGKPASQAFVVNPS